jgi:hypothetical protein
MAINRRNYKTWKKVRTDRLRKLIREDVTDDEADVIVNSLVLDERTKLVHKQADDGMVWPALQLRYKAYQDALAK